ncbi:MAG: hypothetical protein DMG72_06330 [Acidobacteria bacterium]|nr:MAG: hypothetical protein DMG98_23360 [Acidobacteriota bacterium]PYX75913.1 MAG: hypothetical protein DMG72_06330 [Acidobacteriota bacterium]
MEACKPATQICVATLRQSFAADLTSIVIDRLEDGKEHPAVGAQSFEVFDVHEKKWEGLGWLGVEC